MDYVTLNLSYKGKDLSRKYLSTILFLFFLLTVTAQTDTSTSKPSKQIDPSKPSNLYTQVNGNLEFQSSSSNNLYGLRVNVQYAFNPNNLFFLELPLLNNSKG
jgi:hypothetical protein